MDSLDISAPTVALGLGIHLVSVFLVFKYNRDEFCRRKQGGIQMIDDSLPNVPEDEVS
jgi:hypothetical protein